MPIINHDLFLPTSQLKIIIEKVSQNPFSVR